MAVRFRPTADDERIIRTFKQASESDADVLRRGLRSLDRLAREERERADAARHVIERRGGKSLLDR
jgi:hypothetical protein